MSEGPQYTSCVDKAAWKSVLASIGAANIIIASAAITAIAAGVVFPPIALVGLVVAFAAGAEILRKVAGWLLNGKLICMHNAKRRVFTDADPDRVCVLGSVVDFEQVGEEKSAFETIDNDFAVNLLLAPMGLAEIAAAKDDATLKAAAENGPQGDLIQDPQPPAVPAEQPAPPPALKRKDDPTKNFGPMPAGFTGYSRPVMVSKAFARPIPLNAFRDPSQLVKFDPLFKQIGDDAHAAFVADYQGQVVVDGQSLTPAQKQAILDAAAENPLANPEVKAKFYNAVAALHFKEKLTPVLHCEFEGSRIHDVYEVLDFAHVECDSSGWLGFLCDLLNLVLSLVLGLPKLIAAIVAWASADEGALSDAYDGASGELRWGDPVVVRGRWAYDGGHDGYNEIHAVRTLQKTLPSPTDETGFLAFRNAWCAELSKVPPSPPPPDRQHTGVPAPTKVTPPPPGGPPPPPGGTPPPPLGSPPPYAAPPPMTPAQLDTWTAQQRDENRWVYHPAIDGCLPAPGVAAPTFDS